MTLDDYRRWLDVARRCSRRADDAEDLLQESLLAALKAQREPAAYAAWFHGVIRNLAAMRARTAVRERVRTESITADRETHDDVGDLHGQAWRDIDALPHGLRRVAVLALSGLERAEIRQVLAISDTALRQRLAALRRRLGGQRNMNNFHALAAAYAARLAQNNPPGGGPRRAALSGGPARLAAFRFAVTDPEGNMLAVSGPGDATSRNDDPRQQQDEPASPAGESKRT